MKEHIFSRPLLKIAGNCQEQQRNEMALAPQPSLNDKPALNTPCIVVHGFRDLHHFLSWFQIHVPQPITFPASQGRYVKQERECITICGFSDLDDFLSSFKQDGIPRQTALTLRKSKVPAS